MGKRVRRNSMENGGKRDLGRPAGCYWRRAWPRAGRRIYACTPAGPIDQAYLASKSPEIPLRELGILAIITFRDESRHWELIGIPGLRGRDDSSETIETGRGPSLRGPHRVETGIPGKPGGDFFLKFPTRSYKIAMDIICSQDVLGKLLLCQYLRQIQQVKIQLFLLGDDPL